MFLNLVEVKHIRVKPGRLEVTLRFSKTAPLVTDDLLIRRVLQDFPYLAEHTCKNEVGPTFGEVMYQTSVAHLFEHMVIDLQAQMLLEQGYYNQSSIILVGNTQIDMSNNEAYVSISFVNDLIALDAVKKAQELLNYYLK